MQPNTLAKYDIFFLVDRAFALVSHARNTDCAMSEPFVAGYYTTMSS
jgi:hypothetical protein